MQSNFIFREATINDIEQLKQLGLVSYGQYAPFLTEENLEKLKRNIGNNESWKNILAVAKSFVCVLDSDSNRNEIIGMAFLIPSGNEWDIFKAEWSYIRMVGVSPMHQGKGIAKTLTQKCIDYAKATDEKIIALHTSEMMHAARHIYESLGFTILQEIEPRLGVKYWIYTLSIAK